MENRQWAPTVNRVSVTYKGHVMTSVILLLVSVRVGETALPGERVTSVSRDLQ